MPAMRKWKQLKPSSGNTFIATVDVTRFFFRVIIRSILMAVYLRWFFKRYDQMLPGFMFEEQVINKIFISSG